MASDPLPLLRTGRADRVSCLPRRCCQDGGGTPAGFVTFSYELAPLMLTNDDLSLFSVALKDPRSDNGELIANDQGVVDPRSADSQARRRR